MSKARTICEAVRSGNLNDVNKLIADGACLNIGCMSHHTGESPLFLAIQNNYPDIVKELAKSGAFVNDENDAGRSPLYVASMNGYSEICKILLKYGAHINGQCQLDGKTALAIATEHCKPAVVEILLKANADMEIRDNYGYNPLLVAIQNGNYLLCELLVFHGANVNSACSTNDISIWHSPPEGVFRNSALPSALLLALENGNMPIFNLLLRVGANVNCKNRHGCTLLITGIERGLDNQQILSLLTHGADPNLKDENHYTPLMMAAEKGKVDICKSLIDHGASVGKGEEEDFGALMACISTPKTLKFLLSNGVDPNAHDSSMSTVLISALKCNDLNACSCKVLLEYGADPCATDAHGECVCTVMRRSVLVDVDLEDTLVKAIYNCRYTLFMLCIWNIKRRSKSLDGKEVFDTIPVHVFRAYFKKTQWKDGYHMGL